jgi:hypothetical protein
MARRPFLTILLLVLTAGVVQAAVATFAPAPRTCGLSCSACGPMGQAADQAPSAPAVAR